jgi:hypothetical protein
MTKNIETMDMTEFETKNLTEIINTLLKGGTSPDKVLECVLDSMNGGGVTQVIAYWVSNIDVKAEVPYLDKKQCGAVLDQIDLAEFMRCDDITFCELADCLYPLELPETVNEHLMEWLYGDDNHRGENFEAIDEAWKKFLETPLEEDVAK